MRIFFGGASGLVEPSVRLSSPELSSRFGCSIASAGDTNGDGYADLVVGASDSRPATASHRGEAYVYLGGPSGPAAAPDATLFASSGMSFGQSVAGGDVDGDGYGDVVVGTAFDDTASFASVFRGGPSGVSTSATALRATAAVFSPWVSTADVDGDGYADVLATGFDASSSATLVFAGASLGIGTAPSARIVHSTVMDDRVNLSGRSVGDADGDGYADVAFGLPFANAQQGYVFLHLGGPSGLASAPDTTFTNVDSGGFRAGGSVSGGDLDGDGFADLYVGAEDVLAPIALPIYGGSLSGVSSDPTASIPSPAGRGARFSASVE